MTNMQFANTGQLGKRLNVVIVQGMPGVEAHAQVANGLAGLADLVEFSQHSRCFVVTALIMKGVSVRAGVDFTDARADPRRRFDLSKFGIDEDTGHDSGIGESGNHIPQMFFLSHNVKPALRCHLVATFRNEHCHLRLERTGNTDHFISCRHLQIQLDLRRLT